MSSTGFSRKVPVFVGLTLLSMLEIDSNDVLSKKVTLTWGGGKWLVKLTDVRGAVMTSLCLSCVLQLSYAVSAECNIETSNRTNNNN